MKERLRAWTLKERQQFFKSQHDASKDQFSGKRDNAVYTVDEFCVEFEMLYFVKPELNLLAAVFNDIESKYSA